MSPTLCACIPAHALYFSIYESTKAYLGGKNNKNILYCGFRYTLSFCTERERLCRCRSPRFSGARCGDDAAGRGEAANAAGLVPASLRCSLLHHQKGGSARALLVVLHDHSHEHAQCRRARRDK